jgi:hypothetical protein
VLAAGAAADSAWIASLLARGAIAGVCTRADPRVCTTERVGALVVRLNPPVRSLAGDTTRVSVETHAYAECGGAARRRVATLLETAGDPRVVRLEQEEGGTAACGPPRLE